MKNLPEARVARLAECHKKQKAGYGQHASPNFPNTTPNSATLRPKILNVLIDMKKNNKSDYTINFTRKALSYLGKHTSLEEPEAVKLLIAELKSSDGYKRNLCIAYNKYCKFYNIAWNMPKYREEAKNIALPTREKIQMLIANAGKLLSMKLQLSMETGLRPIELTRLARARPFQTIRQKTARANFYTLQKASGH